MSKNTSPQLHANDAEDEEYEETEEKHIAEHGKSIKQKHHQYAHTCRQTVEDVSAVKRQMFTCNWAYTTLSKITICLI